MTAKDWQKPLLGALVTTLMSALGDALDEVAKMKGEDGIAWLDQFEASTKEQIKNSVAEGITMESEVLGMEASMKTIEMIVLEAKKRAA